jgi:hypothetical protein
MSEVEDAYQPDFSKLHPRDFTPGPWQLVRSVPADGADCWWICAGNGNREKELATVYGGPSSHEANALLMAGSPELFDALKSLVACWDAYRESDLSHYSAHNLLANYQLFEAARAALANCIAKPSEGQ